MMKDCDDFYVKSGRMWFSDKHETDDSTAGHDFWLTRNRHGAGFWDGDYPKEMGTTLTDLAHTFGECWIYVGDDSLLYIS
jgi:hypothetical protein